MANRCVLVWFWLRRFHGPIAAALERLTDRVQSVKAPWGELAFGDEVRELRAAVEALDDAAPAKASPADSAPPEAEGVDPANVAVNEAVGAVAGRETAASWAPFRDVANVLDVPPAAAVVASHIELERRGRDLAADADVNAATYGRVLDKLRARTPSTGCFAVSGRYGTRRRTARRSPR